MSKVAIVFWSATGNTETMANCIAEGAGAAAAIVPCAEMDAAKLNEYDVVATVENLEPQQDVLVEWDGSTA